MKPYRIYSSFRLFILLSLIILNFTGCTNNDCEPEDFPTKYYYIDNDARTKVLYDGTDTLFFLLNGTDTLTYVSVKTDTAFEYYNGVTDCAGEYQYLEQNNIAFNCISNNAPASLNQINFSLRVIPNALIEWAYIYTNEIIFRATIISIRSPYDYPSIIINNTTHFNVAQICQKDVVNCDDTGPHILYNISDGILRIKTGTEILEIIK